MQRTNVQAVVGGWRRNVFSNGRGHLLVYVNHYGQARKLWKIRGAWHVRVNGMVMPVKFRIKAQGRKTNEDHAQA